MSWDEDRDLDWYQLMWGEYGIHCDVTEFARCTCRGDENGVGERFDSRVMRYRVRRDGFNDINMFMDKHNIGLVSQLLFVRCPMSNMTYYVSDGSAGRTHANVIMDNAKPGDIFVPVNVYKQVDGLVDSGTSKFVPIYTMKPITVLSLDRKDGIMSLLVANEDDSPRVVTYHSRC